LKRTNKPTIPPSNTPTPPGTKDNAATNCDVGKITKISSSEMKLLYWK